MNAQHVIDIASMEKALIERILNRSVAFWGGAEPILQSHTMANVFFEPSTRTRVSFEMAAGRMGLRVINLDGQRSSITKGESLPDTIRTLRAMGVELVVLRHETTGICHQLLEELPDGLHLINAGDGCGHHPTQALLDVATLMAKGVDLATSKVVIVGDLRHSRVARSNASLLKRLGVGEVALAGPEELMPTEGAEFVDVMSYDQLEPALANADVVMMLRVQKERLEDGQVIDPDHYHAHWGLTPEKLALAKDHCWVMHPGPINRGVELSSAVADGPQSLILDQVRMSVCTRMAIFEALLS